MTGSDFNFDGLSRVLAVVLGVLCIMFPLGVWKLVELLMAVWQHVHWE